MEKWIRLPTIAQLLSFGRVSSFRHLPLRKAASRGIILKAIPNVNTYFETLGVGNDSKVPAFDIDLGQLRINYLKFQQRVHPDSESESLEDPELLMKILDTRERLEEATDENEAFKTLCKLLYKFFSNKINTE
ncbi:5378_t:CDS:2, partial [Gigaspora rosea]